MGELSELNEKKYSGEWVDQDHDFDKVGMRNETHAIINNSYQQNNNYQ